MSSQSGYQALWYSKNQPVKGTEPRTFLIQSPWNRHSLDLSQAAARAAASSAAVKPQSASA